MATERKMESVYMSLDEMIRPSHTAILVIDMQEDYCFVAPRRLGLNSAPLFDIIPVIGHLVACARMVGALPIFVQGTLAADGHTHSGVAIANQIHVWGTYGVSADTAPGRDFVDGIGYLPKDIVVMKRRNSAFYGTELDLVLRCNGIQTVVISGKSTFACVDTTARDALCHDYYVVVVRDAVGTVEEDIEYHEASLKVLQHFLPVQGVATSTEILSIWQREDGFIRP
jgi:nicotinamidase-related amidase